MELHVSRAARERYGLDAATLPSPVQDGVEPPPGLRSDLAAAREVAARINRRRPAADVIAPGQLYAVGLIDEILRAVVALYRREHGPDAFADALASIEGRLGREAVESTLRAVADAFPTGDAYAGGVTPDEYLASSTAGRSNRELALERLLHVWLANANPAFAPFRDLFHDAPLRDTAYPQIIAALQAHFHARPPFGPDEQPLVTMLRSPAVAVPDSLAGQLRYIRERWGALLGGLLDRLALLALDVLAEEELALWRRMHPGTGVADGRIGILGDEGESERFSPDRDWMPQLVLMAKSTHVWLDQLSRRHSRDIRTLDAVPDEELDRLARWGFTGLWLIGLWQRSAASQRIKALRGNPDAAASAYSLHEYRIADELGGEAAYEELRVRAWRRGIRLASDMVPNHMGIDSRWLMEHPERFLSLDRPPYPSYTFSGPDLSSDPRVGVYIEDHYWDGTDAAVVFRRVDRWSGEERFVYHGNDGTSTPWNDTAQLDYLRPEVREAVIQTVLDVARRFPVIRFDAAMTLAKRHIQRLWYPEPGGAGAIPSRAEHGLTKAEFDSAMPVEFWREVVDRVAAEAPDTLLLAEAFWLMEGYFVRTLGMHRVYNSAFMHMLRDERNAGYRTVIKETLAFDPEILKRYVNFMNNPDERTAVDQFGKGDKYIGICTLLATLPGLPMFGHGQVEGFAEKYGMEFRRAMWDEAPDPWLVERHEREIFPLLHRRRVFAEAAGFRLYDFVTDGGAVNEDVFAYSNRAGGDRVLIVYHNRYGSASGAIRESVPYAERGQDGAGRRLARQSLADALGVGEPGGWLRFRDEANGVEYLRAVDDLRERGLPLLLGAYQRHVFVDFREIPAAAATPYLRLAERLAGRGVPSLDEALRELVLEPVRAPFARIVSGETATQLAAIGARTATERAAAPSGQSPAEQVSPPAAQTGAEQVPRPGAQTGAELAAAPRAPDASRVPPASDRPAQTLALLERLTADARDLGAAVQDLLRGAGEPTGVDEFVADVRSGVSTALALAQDPTPDALPSPDRATCLALLAWLAGRGLGGGPTVPDRGRRCRQRLREWRLDELISAAFRQSGRDESAAWRATEAVVAMQELPAWRPDGVADAAMVLEGWLSDEGVRRALQVHQYQDVEWFNAETYSELVTWTTWVAATRLAEHPEAYTGDGEPMVGWVTRVGDDLRRAAVAAGYRVDRLPTRARAGRRDRSPGPDGATRRREPARRESVTPSS